MQNSATIHSTISPRYEHEYASHATPVLWLADATTKESVNGNLRATVGWFITELTIHLLHQNLRYKKSRGH